METILQIGLKVKVLKSSHLGKTGTIVAAYPPYAYSPEYLYRVRYKYSLNSGMFKSSELAITEEEK